MPEAESEGRALTYLRVSSRRQMDTAIDIDPDGNSIATQREYVARRAIKLGTGIRREFLEPGTSAQTIAQRPVFRELLRFIKDHPGEIDYVIIYMRSRAFRNYLDAGVTERQLSALGVKLISAKEDFGDGIWGDAMKAVADIMNEVQVRMSGEDIRTKMEHKARSGGTLGRARIGYKNVRAEIDGRLVNTIGIDPERAPLVRRAFEIYAKGDVSLEQLAETMNDLGLTTRPTAKWSEKPVTDSKLHAMLKDPYYLGFVVYKGEVIPGRHEPIVSQALFDQVQDVLAARSARGQRDRVLQHYLKGMVWCERCEQAGRHNRLIYTEARGRSGKHWPYFICRGRQEGVCDLPHVPAGLVEQAIEREYADLKVSEAYATALLAELDRTLANHEEGTRELDASLRKQLAKLNVQEDRLLELTADAALPVRRIRAKLNKLAVDRKAVEEGLARTGKELSVGAELLRAAVTLTRDPEALYVAVEDKTRRSINETFFECFFIDEYGSAARAVRRPPFSDFPAAERVYFARLDARPREQAVSHVRTTADRVVIKGTATVTPTLADVDLVGGSSKTVLVELRGFEPLTPSMRTRCATGLRYSPKTGSQPSKSRALRAPLGAFGRADSGPGPDKGGRLR